MTVDHHHREDGEHDPRLRLGRTILLTDPSTA